MKLVDNNCRLFGKLSVIDVVVILVVAAMGAALYVKNNTLVHTSTNVTLDTITYQVQVNGVPQYVADAIRREDPLYEQDRSTGGSLGKIVSIETAPGTKIAELTDGSVELVPVEDGVNLLLTVKGEGIYKDGRYLLNRIYDLGVNAARTFYTPYAQFQGTVSAIEPVG